MLTWIVDLLSTSGEDTTSYIIISHLQKNALWDDLETWWAYSLKMTTIDIGPVEISEGLRLSVLMIGCTICPPATRGNDYQKLHGLKSNG